METRGLHLIGEFNNCSKEHLNSEEYLGSALRSAAEQAGATVLSSHFHRFEPFGVTGFLCLTESHLSIHSWPEHGYAAIDIFTCGNKACPHQAMAILEKLLQATSVSITVVERGIPEPHGRFRCQVVEAQSELGVSPAVQSENMQ